MARNKKTRPGGEQNPREQFFKLIQPRDYSTPRSIEKMTEKLFKEAAGNIRELRTKDPEYFDLLDTDTARRKRRRSAVLHTMEQVQELVRDICPDAEPRFYIVEEWAKTNAIGMSSYDLLENSSGIILGAAIWILDRIRENGSWTAMRKLMPTDIDEIYAPEMPTVFDLCYSEEILREMVYVIRERNSDCAGLHAGTKKSDSGHVLMDACTAAGKQHQDVPSRRRFEAMLSLIDEDAKKTATAHFEEKLWEWVQRYFTARADTARREGLNAKQFNGFIKRARRDVERFQDQTPNLLRRGAAGVAFPMAEPLPESLLLGPKSLSPLRGALNLTRELFSEGEKLVGESDLLEDEIHALMFNSNLHCNAPLSDLAEEIGECAAEQISGFSIEDPYEMCFALIALIDADSDLPWLYYPGTAVMRSAVGQLPWHFDDFLNDNAYWPELWDEEEQELYGSEAYQARVKKRQAPELMDWYSPKYTPRTHGEERMEERVNLAQIVYRLTGCIPPRNAHRYDAALSVLADYSITGKKMLVPLLYCLSMLGEGRHQRQDTREYIPDEGDAEEMAPGGEAAAEISPEACQETIRQLKAENDQLKKSLYDAGREAREVRRKLEAQNKIWEQERQELHDFRELFFNQGQDEEEQIEQDAGKISYPYTTRKRTVVFGGHDTWLKVIRPMLPEVRFVGREAIPNPDMIRHADVVWIQSNALAHKHYYKLIDVTRTYHIPVRYFKNASAEKCARQLIEEDEK